MLQIYNSLTHQKEIFKPIRPGKVGIYVCGITVYDHSHIGHARMYVAFDVITRYLRTSGYEVNYIRNITDIDDKIIKRANENNEPYTVLTERMIKSFHDDMHMLGILPPNIEPRATNYIPHMIKIIQTLLDKGFAYKANSGDICYAVSKFKTYGELAHQDLENLRAGARVAISDDKHDPLDFVLWKLAKPGEPSWESPWGAGRPGWHIECSAMSMDCLGETFDIHGGGFDLTFPHHQNELAQSEAATGKKFVNVWMHNGFLQVNKEKMSKSLNNFFTIKDVLAEYSAEVVRYFLLASHYRSPINYSEESLQGTQAALERFYTALRGLDLSAKKLENTDYEKRFKEAMDDDFNTPIALAALFDLVREINRVKQEDMQQANQLGATLRYLADILGILQQDPEAFLQGNNTKIDTAKVQALIDARNAARAAKNWAEADRIRGELTALGIELEDGASGTSWRAVDS